MSQQQQGQQQGAQNYEMGGLPVPKQVGSFIALQTYFTQGAVQERVAFRLNGNKDRAKEVLANLYEVVETTEDPTELLKCDPRSLITACIQANRVGLSIDKRGHAWVVPYFNKHKQVKEAQMQIGYKGYIARLHERLDNCTVHVDLVHQGDTFTVKKSGSREQYEHTPADPFSTGEKGCIGAYCYVEWTDNGEVRSIVGRMSIEEIKKVQGIAKSQKVWGPWWNRQALKTVIKRTCEYKFSSITEDLNEIDNTGYDLSMANPDKPATSGRASASDIDERMRKEDNPQDETEDSSVKGGDDGGQIIDVDPETGEVVDEEQADGSRSADDAGEPAPDATPSSTPQQEEAQAAETASNEGEKQEAEPMEIPKDAPRWDGKTLVIQGKVITKDFTGIRSAVKYLTSVIEKRTKRSVRSAILRDNIALTNSLIGQGLMAEFDALHKLVSEGEEDATDTEADSTTASDNPATGDDKGSGGGDTPERGK